MKVLILGGKGMLGHKLCQTAGDPFDVWTTVREDPRQLFPYGFYCPDRILGYVDALDADSVRRAVDRVEPDAVINCIGIVKQHPSSQDPEVCIPINARFPHFLAALCREHGSRLVHISTDCVFSGSKGGYREEDLADAKDLYGRTKAQGETQASNAITLRTSIVGREIGRGRGLVEWFLSQNGTPVQGYTRARFSGLTTHELARVIWKVLSDHPDLFGIYQVAGEPIDKRSLIECIRDAFGGSTPIIPCDKVQIDRTLNGARFCQATGYLPPKWAEMVREMASDPTPYDTWRSH